MRGWCYKAWENYVNMKTELLSVRNVKGLQTSLVKAIFTHRGINAEIASILFQRV